MATRKLAPAERREMEIRITQPRRYAAREGEPAQGFRFAFLASEAARLRHGQGAAISRPGLQLGRVGWSPGFTEPTLALRALRQASARFRPRPGRTPQLSDRSTSLPRTAVRTLSFRSDGRKLARPDETGRAPRCQSGRTSRRRTLTALASQRPRTPAGPASRSAQVPVRKDLSAARGSNGSQVRRSR